MAIDYKDFMHGAALVAIADSSAFTALNKASVKYGHYIVNHDRHIFIKYNAGSGPGDYHFTFNGGDKQRIRDADGRAVFAVLVCGDEVVTAIRREELVQMIDLGVTAAESILVRAEAGKQLRISSSRAELANLPRNAFPARVLE